MAGKHGKVEVGTGNVFADLGFKGASERKLRVQLALRINELLEERGLTQAKAARIFGIPQPHVSELENYKLSRFSAERLMRFLTVLGYNVEISIQPKAKDHECGLVSVSGV